MAKARLSSEQRKEVEALITRNDLKSALVYLKLVATEQNDVELRQFACDTHGHLSSITDAFTANDILWEEKNKHETKLRRAILTQLKCIKDADAVVVVKGELPPPDKAEKVQPPAAKSDAVPAAQPTSAPMLQCKDLSRSYGPSFKLPSVTFQLGHGEILGVVGYNGAGKTTLLRMIVGDLKKTSGSVDISRRNDRGQKLENPVTFVPQTPPSWNGTLRNHLRRQASFYGFTDPKENKDRVGDMVSLLGLDVYLEHQFHELPAGFRTRGAIAAALMAKPGLLVLDEPLAPLDPRSQQRLLQELAMLASAARTAIVISSQHIREIESIAHWILTISETEAKLVRAPKQYEPVGAFFQVDIFNANNQLQKHLRDLQTQNIIETFHMGTSSVVVGFRESRTIEEAFELLKVEGVMGIRNISQSVLLSHYAADKQDGVEPKKAAQNGGEEA